MRQRQVEQRRYDRYELIDFGLLDVAPNEEPLRCVVVDASLGGLQVRSRSKIPLNKRLRLQIATSLGEPVEVWGEVRHSAQISNGLYASGFTFLPDSPSQRAGVAAYVHSVFVRRTQLQSA